MTIHLWPALLSAVIALVALLLIAAGVRVDRHSRQTAQAIAEQADEHEDAP